uniref:SHSP domain-containing protein n=1 Tax=Opuntia streptacantha TaxID=393608 RepID=A0A7C8ZAE1_OPUST
MEIMASKALTCSASSLVASKASNSNPNLPSGFVRRCVSFPSSSPSSKSPSSRPNSLVIKAQSNENAHLYLPYSWLHYKPALIDTPPYVRTPWGHSVMEKEIMMSFDMPGADASELEVMILGDELNVRFKGPKDKIDALGRKITGLYDTKIQLPANCIREKAEAEFKNGILYVRIPRMPMDRDIPIRVPVRAVI